MGQKMRFGLVLGQLAILKKMGPDYEQLLQVFFFMFSGADFFLKNIVASTLKSCIN